MLTNFADAHPLSVVEISSDGEKNFWAPKVTGEYIEDCARGRAAARETIDYVREMKSPNIVGSIFRDMIKAGIYDAFEIGFCAAIGMNIVDK